MSEDEIKINEVLNDFALQVVHGMEPVCELYAEIQTKQLEQQVADMRALLVRVEEVNAAEYYHVTALQDEIKAYLEGSNKSNGER